jgi:hypothetical protein
VLAAIKRQLTAESACARAIPHHLGPCSPQLMLTYDSPTPRLASVPEHPAVTNRRTLTRKTYAPSCEGRAWAHLADPGHVLARELSFDRRWVLRRHASRPAQQEVTVRAGPGVLSIQPDEGAPLHYGHHERRSVSVDRLEIPRFQLQTDPGQTRMSCLESRGSDKASPTAAQEG